MLFSKILSKVWPFLVILFLLCFGYYQYKQISELKQETADRGNALFLADQKVETIKTKNGELLFQNRTLQGNSQTMSLILNNELANLKQEFGDIKNIKSYIKSGIQSSGKFYTVLNDSTLFDTIHIKTFNYSDRWLSQNCTIKNDSVNCSYSYTDSVEVVLFRNRNWRWIQFHKAREMKQKGFSKYSYKTSVKFSNPNSSTNYIKSVIKETE